MRSAKNSSTIRFHCLRRSMPNCCGVGMITEHNAYKEKWILIHQKYLFSWETRRKDGKVKRRQEIAWHKKINPRNLSRTIMKEIKEAFQHYSLLYVALPQHTELYRQITKWYKKHGWKIENETKSNHGDYKIYVMSMTKDKWKEKYAV